MPVILVVCVAITVIVAINANKREIAEEEAVNTTDNVEIVSDQTIIP